MEHTRGVDIVIVSPRVEAECVPDLVGVCVIFVADVGVRPLRVESLLGWELLLVYLLPTIHKLVRVHPLAYEEMEHLHLMHVELLHEMFEAVEARFEQVLSERGESPAQELKALFEDQVFAQGE